MHAGGRCNLKEVAIKDILGTGITCAGSATMEKCTITRAGMVGVAVIADGVASIRRCQVLRLASLPRCVLKRCFSAVCVCVVGLVVVR